MAPARACRGAGLDAERRHAGRLEAGPALGRSLPQLVATVRELEERGLGLRLLTEGTDTTTASGTLVFHVFGALAQFERDLIRERTMASLAAARARAAGGEGGSPHQTTYLDLVVESGKTPVPARSFTTLLGESVSHAAWGEANLKGDSEGTSADNETSIVQFADVCGTKVLLTGDAGVRSLTKAHQAAFQMGIVTGPLDWFQEPHHGSRRNLSSDVLDKWLGPRLDNQVKSPASWAIVSANQNDQEHPKKAIVRALIHRGRSVFQTSGTLNVRSKGAPDRGWTSALPLKYPPDQED